MSLTCLDGDKKPRYYGGRAAMAFAIHVEETAAGWQAVHRCVKVLVDSGAIERDYFGHSGKRSEYLVKVRDRPAKGVTQSIAKGVTSSTERVSLSEAVGIDSVTPLGTTEEPTNEHIRNHPSRSEGEYRARAVARAKEPRVSPIDQLMSKRSGMAAS
jgi:hypothetical protein